MEKIKRFDQPATLIIEDEEKWAPKRAERFEISSYGDYGGKVVSR